MTALRTILLVEDDAVDRMLVRRALGDLHIVCTLVEALHGEAALAQLRAPGQMRPDLILLDLNMPRMNGLEFLAEVKREAPLRAIPVVVLTTSREETDRRASLEAGAAGYIVKPAEYDEFLDAMAVLRSYWSLAAPLS